MLQIVEDQLAEVEHGKLRYAVPLAAVLCIVAFKRDMLTTDLLCLEFRYVDTAGTPMHVEINEDMPGFEQVIAALERKMPGFDKDWRAKVVNPPFAQNETVIFRMST